MSEDFAVWPLFLLLLLSFCSMILGKLYGQKYGYIFSKILILLVCLGILGSLYHDSTDSLNFYF